MGRADQGSAATLPGRDANAERHAQEAGFAAQRVQLDIAVREVDDAAFLEIARFATEEVLDARVEQDRRAAVSERDMNASAHRPGRRAVAVVARREIAPLVHVVDSVDAAGR